MDDLLGQISNVERAEKWQKILNTLNAGEMPPEDEKQPEPKARADFLEDLPHVMVAARKGLGDQHGKTVLRRLKRREYRNTLRELLDVELEVNELPADTRLGAFHPIGGTLQGSGRSTGALVNKGLFAPGNSPGIASYGSYTEAGILDIEIGGTAAGVDPTGFDQVRVTGAFTAESGILRLTQYNGFDPKRGQSFQVIQAASYSGTFGLLDRNSHAFQALYDHSTGTVYGIGLRESQTFSEHSGSVANRGTSVKPCTQTGSPPPRSSKTVPTPLRLPQKPSSARAHWAPPPPMYSPHPTLDSRSTPSRLS